MNFVKFLRTPFLQNTSGQLLLNVTNKNQLLFLLHLGSSLKMGTGTEPNKVARGRGFLSTKSNQVFYHDQRDNFHRTLQILASSYF